MYATVQDLIDRRGEAELIRLTTPEGGAMDRIDTARAARALQDASDLADTYLRRRYQVPLPVVPQSIVAAVCDLARYDLFDRGDSAPTEQVVRARRERIAWLQSLQEGKATLDGVVPTGDLSGAMVSDREPMFRAGARLWLP